MPARATSSERNGRFIPDRPGVILPQVPGGSVQTNSVVNNVNATVDGSRAGSPEQNDDLARKIGVQVRNEMGAVATMTIRKQMLPGGMLKS